MKLKERLAFMMLGGLLVLLWQMPMASSEDTERKGLFDDIFEDWKPLPPIQGPDPYTPTKMEWLVLNLNVDYHDHDYKVPIIDLWFVGGEGSDGNTVIVRVYYSPTADRKDLNFEIDSAKRRAKSMAENYGWDWIEIREDVHMLK